MPLARALAYAVFTLWVSICAFAPEFIWQGFLLTHSHFGLAEAYSALFIGALFAFFVEPLVERVKAGHWRLAHDSSRGLLLGTLVSLTFGVVVVCLHEAMAAYLGAGHTGDAAKRASVVQAISTMQEWASIPAAVTAAWFVVGTSHRLALPAVGFACVWMIAVGYFYNWGWQVVATTAVPCCLIAVLGIRIVIRHWDASTIPALAKLTASLASGWLLLAWLVEVVTNQSASSGFQVYAPDAYYDDLRFYLGWSLGLFVAPNPIREH